MLNFSTFSLISIFTCNSIMILINSAWKGRLKREGYDIAKMSLAEKVVNFMPDAVWCSIPVINIIYILGIIDSEKCYNDFKEDLLTKKIIYEGIVEQPKCISSDPEQLNVENILPKKGLDGDNNNRMKYSYRYQDSDEQDVANYGSIPEGMKVTETTALVTSTTETALVRKRTLN